VLPQAPGRVGRDPREAHDTHTLLPLLLLRRLQKCCMLSNCDRIPLVRAHPKGPKP